MYHRAKKEDSKKGMVLPMYVCLGSYKDSFDDLQVMCNNKCIELTKTLDLELNEDKHVSFWTADPNLPPELIGTADFTKDLHGNISFRLDYSRRTL